MTDSRFPHGRRDWLPIALVVGLSVWSVAARIALGPYSFIPWLDEAVGVPPLLAANARTLIQGSSPLWTEGMLGGFNALLYPGQLNLLILPYLVLPDWAAYGFVLIGSRILGGWFCFKLARERLDLGRSASLVFAALFILASPIHGHSEVTATFTGLTHFGIPAAIWALTGQEGSIRRHMAVMTLLGLLYGLATATVSYSYNVFILLALWPAFFPAGALRRYFAGYLGFSAAAALGSIPLMIAVRRLGAEIPHFANQSGLESWRSLGTAAETILFFLRTQPGDTVLFATLPTLVFIGLWRQWPKAWLRGLALAALFLATAPLHAFLFDRISAVLPVVGRLRPRSEVPTVFVLVLLSALSFHWLVQRHRDFTLVALGAGAALIAYATAQINVQELKRGLGGNNWANFFHHPDLITFRDFTRDGSAPRAEMVGVFTSSRLGLARMPEHTHPLYLSAHGLRPLGGVSPVLPRRTENYWRLITGQTSGKPLLNLTLDGGTLEIDQAGECGIEIPALPVSDIVQDADLLRLAGVGHLISPRPLAGAGWKQIDADRAERRRQDMCLSSTARLKKILAGDPVYSPYFIYASIEAPAPRAFVAGAVVVAADRARAGAVLTVERDRTARRLAVLESSPAVQRAVPKACPGAGAALVSDSPTQLVIEAEAPAACVLVVTNTFDTGWRATVNGRPSEIVPANLAFQAVLLPPGRSRIELSYDAL